MLYWVHFAMSGIWTAVTVEYIMFVSWSIDQFVIVHRSTFYWVSLLTSNINYNIGRKPEKLNQFIFLFGEAILKIFWVSCKPPKMPSSKITYQESYTILASCFFYYKVPFFFRCLYWKKMPIYLKISKISRGSISYTVSWIYPDFATKHRI